MRKVLEELKFNGLDLKNLVGLGIDGASVMTGKRNRVVTRKSVHRTRMPPPNAIQKKGLYVTVTGIP